MIKSYRRRFVMFNMLLSGVVLLISFASLGVFMGKQEYHELENTMSIIIKPWNEGNISTADEPVMSDPSRTSPPEKPRSEREGDPPERRDPHDPEHGEQRVRGDNYELFTTVFYRPDLNKISVISRGTADAEIIDSAVYAAAKKSESFGELSELDLYYYKETTRDSIKVALIPTSYFTLRLVRKLLFLTLLLLLSLGAIFGVSVWLSHLAARPLDQAIEMERNFVADISHDLKTPITIVLANNSILKSNPDATVSQQRQWIDSTDQAAKNMMNLVGEMLTLSQMESIDRSADRERVSLSSVCEKCILQLESLAYEQNITIDADIAPDVYILSTAEYTERICSGLIENALKYEPAGGRITAAVTKGRKRARLTVTNAGSVISEDDLPHIFERFYRADKTRGESKGYGLGLPIIRQITELIGATITAASSGEHGTVFTVDFEQAE